MSPEMRPALFQYMLLLRGATYTCEYWYEQMGFNTCSSCEEQLVLTFCTLFPVGFNTCSSCEEQLYIRFTVILFDRVSIHAPLARSNVGVVAPAEHDVVSIHAPLARSNSTHHRIASGRRCFNTCSSCEEQHNF